jgi:GGDEF domain-containing protein
MLDIFNIYSHTLNPIPQDRFLGRVLLSPERSFILEDSYDVLLNIFNSEDAKTTLMQLKNLAMNPLFTVKTNSQLSQKEVPVLESADTPTIERKWLYTAPGEPEPKTLLMIDNRYILDGKTLDSDGVAEVMSNLESGQGQLKALGTLKKALPGDKEPKNPSILPEAKVVSTHPEDILAHLQSLVGKNGIEQSHIDSLRNEIFKDPMTGLGNRKSWEQFSSKAKPGVYASLDLNNMKNINLKHGHLGGDEAIRGFGQAMRQAGDTVGQEHMKLHHISGDEFIAHAPTHEHMHNFIQNLHQNLEALPPVGGMHKISGSIGIGNDYATADKALYAAKDAKLAHQSKGSSLPETTPSFAHSLIPGHEGPINLNAPKLIKKEVEIGNELQLKKFAKSNPKGVFVTFKGGNTGIDSDVLNPIVQSAIQVHTPHGKVFLSGKTYQIFTPTRKEAEDVMQQIREDLLKGD